MDLAKIIAEMKVELQCLDTAIASVEELARLQNAFVPDEPPPTPSNTNPAGDGEESAPVKRPRGRPRKKPPADANSSSMPGDDPAVSVA